MEQKPLFSTLCTSFGRLEMLKNCIKSVRNNTFQNWQLIIGDSTKDPGQRKQINEYCQKIIKEDKRIKFKQYRAWSDREDQLKCNYAWKNNQMFKLADGKYITYHNDDDVYTRDYYQSFVEAINQFPEGKVFYTGQKAFRVRNDDDYTEEDLCRVLPADSIKRCMFFCVDQICVAHHRDIFTEVGGWETGPHVNTYADAEFWYKIAEKGYLAYPTCRFTTLKSIHAGQISNQAGRPEVHGKNNNEVLHDKSKWWKLRK
jgi:glycosyltransferase involved in cell wall biosynthesis